MSAGCVRWMLSRTVRAVCGGSRGYWTPPSRLTICSERSNTISLPWRWSPFSTEADDTEQSPAPKKIKHDPRAGAAIGAVGRMIPQRQIQVISEMGEDLGTMHRAEVLKIMDTQGLKLVLRNGHNDPAVYQLMSGKQIHEEQLKLREKQKAKAASVQVKEIALSSGIAAHDLATKMKRVESWVEKKNHVRITLRSGRGRPAVDLDTALEQIVQQMEMTVGFVSKPKAIQDGQAAMCIIRPPSAKEKKQNQSQKEKNKDAVSQSGNSSSNATESKTSNPPVSNTDTSDGSIQQ